MFGWYKNWKEKKRKEKERKAINELAKKLIPPKRSYTSYHNSYTYHHNPYKDKPNTHRRIEEDSNQTIILAPVIVEHNTTQSPSPVVRNDDGFRTGGLIRDEGFKTGGVETNNDGFKTAGVIDSDSFRTGGTMDDYTPPTPSRSESYESPSRSESSYESSRSESYSSPSDSSSSSSTSSSSGE